jgi:hypothetical protein
MPEIIETTTTTQTEQVVQPTTTTTQVEGSTETGQVETTEQQKSYVKIREEKAREKVLKTLGVATEDEAKAKLSEAAEALRKVTELEQKLAAAEAQRITDLKVSKLTKLLDDENAFDTDALLHYVDLDKVNLDASGNVQDSANILTALKTAKPHFFGQTKIKTDAFIKGTNQTLNPVEEKYKSGNYVGAVSEYLKNIKK